MKHFNRIPIILEMSFSILTPNKASTVDKNTHPSRPLLEGEGGGAGRGMRSNLPFPWFSQPPFACYLNGLASGRGEGEGWVCRLDNTHCMYSEVFKFSVIERKCKTITVPNKMRE